MAIKATEIQQRELIPPGNYVAICYKMLQIGTIDNTYMGVTSKKPVIRIGWELCDELKVFKEGDIPKPWVIEKEYNLFMTDKSNLRKDLQSWRGAAWTDKEATDFDITKLVGAPCLLNIIHKTNEAGTKTYENIAGITPLPKSTPKPKQFNTSQILSYDDWDEKVFQMQPDFIRQKIESSLEYQTMKNPHDVVQYVDAHGMAPNLQDDDDGLPF
jgi:hypothetical protein